MIQKLTSLEGYWDFIEEINRDPSYSEPMLSSQGQIEQNLIRAFQKPQDQVWGVRQNGEIAGLFVFLIIEDEKYIEMIVGLSRSAAVYEEIAAYLEAHYPSYQADFVFNPKNDLLQTLLRRKQAAFFPEVQKMVLFDPPYGVDTSGIQLLSERYMAQYIAMHGTDAYWTGEKVAKAGDRFRVLLAVEDGTVVGYMDVTHCFEENEPYDLLVKPAYRRRGYGRRLLAKAIELNRPKGMMLLVEVDNFAAIHLYESMGFRKIEGQGNITASWKI